MEEKQKNSHNTFHCIVMDSTANEREIFKNTYISAINIKNYNINRHSYTHGYMHDMKMF